MGKLAITGGEQVRKKRFDPWPVYSDKERHALEDVLTNRNWGGQPFPGKHSEAFNRKFAEFHTAKYGQVVSTGTVAIQAALKAIDIRPGDEVIVPAYTWEGTVGPVLLLNAVPVFVDVDPDTYCLDAKLIEQAITPKTKAILPVHLGMRFADLDEIMAIAARHNLKVVEDCAHAHGGMWRGKGAGSTGDLGAFSFQSSKLITSGEGGAVITNNLEYFERVQSYINTGRASVTDQFHHRLIGFNYRLGEFQAAVLGLWGLSYPSTERLALDAPRVRCPVLFQRKADDELFTPEGQIELFSLLGSAEKRLAVYPGRHGTPSADQQADVIGFLTCHLEPGGLATR